MVNGTRARAAGRVAIAAMLALVLGSGGVSSALAQDTLDSLNSFRLPPGPGSVLPSPAATPTADPSPTIAAPVQTPDPAPSPTPSPTVSPASPSARPSPRAAPTAAASPPAPAPSPRAAPPRIEAVQPVEPGVTAVPAPVAAPARSPLPIALPTVPMPGAVAETAPTLAPTPEAGIDWKVWAAIAVALIAAAAWVLRGRIALARRNTDRSAAEPQPAPAATPATASPPAALPSRPHRPQARVTPSPRPQPLAPPPGGKPAPPASAQRGDEPLTVTLSARRLSATLLNTALSYELVVTNLGEIAIGPLAVTCDMIGAHSSLPVRFQLENPGQGDPDHRIPHLGPGESATIGGEMRLPLTAITPIRHGEAALFVPLARFRILVWRDGRPPVAINRTFVIGETPPSPDAALKPFRLDLGPRMYSSISQREVAVPA